MNDVEYLLFDSNEKNSDKIKTSSSSESDFVNSIDDKFIPISSLRNSADKLLTESEPKEFLNRMNDKFKEMFK